MFIIIVCKACIKLVSNITLDFVKSIIYYITVHQFFSFKNFFFINLINIVKLNYFNISAEIVEEVYVVEGLRC